MRQAGAVIRAGYRKTSFHEPKAQWALLLETGPPGFQQTCSRLHGVSGSETVFEVVCYVES